MNGKENVMCLNNEYYFSASTQVTYEKWVTAFKNIKQTFILQQQKEKEIFKQEMGSTVKT